MKNAKASTWRPFDFKMMSLCYNKQKQHKMTKTQTQKVSRKTSLTSVFQIPVYMYSLVKWRLMYHNNAYEDLWRRFWFKLVTVPYHIIKTCCSRIVIQLWRHKYMHISFVSTIFSAYLLNDMLVSQKGVTCRRNTFLRRFGAIKTWYWRK